MKQDNLALPGLAAAPISTKPVNRYHFYGAKSLLDAFWPMKNAKNRPKSH